MKNIKFEVFESSPVSEADCIQIGRLYCSVGWGREYTISQLKAIFDGAQYHVLARCGGEVVGALRALSDGCFTTWIADVAVDPKYQGCGVGRSMMETLINKYKHTAIYSNALIGSVEFFNKLGVTEKTKLVACSRRQD